MYFDLEAPNLQTVVLKLYPIHQKIDEVIFLHLDFWQDQIDQVTMDVCQWIIQR